MRASYWSTLSGVDTPTSWSRDRRVEEEDYFLKIFLIVDGDNIRMFNGGELYVDPPKEEISEHELYNRILDIGIRDVPSAEVVQTHWNSIRQHHREQSHVFQWAGNSFYNAVSKKKLKNFFILPV